MRHKISTLRKPPPPTKHKENTANDRNLPGVEELGIQLRTTTNQFQEEGMSQVTFCLLVTPKFYC